MTQPMKLSKTLRELSRSSQRISNSQLLHECADAAEGLEHGIYEDVSDFHLKFGHPAPTTPNDTPYHGMLVFRCELIREECEELCEAIMGRNLAKIASEAVDVIYVVVGTLVALGLPLMPFWRDVQRANMAKVAAGPRSKPLKPEGWQKPDAAEVLYKYKQGLR